MLAVRCYRARLLYPTLAKRWSIITIRHNSTSNLNKRETIHLAINLLFPGLGDPQYSERYEAVNKQIEEAFLSEDNAKVCKHQCTLQNTRIDFKGTRREYNYLKKLIDTNKDALTDLNKQLSMLSVDNYIDMSMTCNGYSTGFESEDEFYNEILELDKFDHNAELNPLIFCTNSYAIERCAKYLFAKQCETRGIQLQLFKLRRIGQEALKVYWNAYLKRDLKMEELNFTTLVTATGLFNLLNGRVRNLIKRTIHNDLQYSFIFYQYLGLLVVKNGELSSHFIHSMARFLEDYNKPKNAYQLMKLPTIEQVDDVEATIANFQEDTAILKKLIQFAEYTIKLIGKRTELLQGHVRQRNNSLLLVKKSFPELNEETNMAKLGYLITKNYKKYALDLLGFAAPILSFGTKLHLVKVFAMSNFELPVISNNAPKTKSPYQILPPIMNSNLINRILLLSKHLYFGNSDNGKFITLTIRNFELFGHISYSYFTRLALERMESTTLINTQLKKLGDMIESHSFKSYIVDLMKFFENQKERKSYMLGIETLKKEQLLSLNQFNLIFACLSEEQKENWCHELVTKVVTVMSQLDWQYIDEFFVELRSQLLKRKEYLNTLSSSTSNKTTNAVLNKLQNVSVSFSKMDDSLYYNLAIEYVSYLNTKYHINQPLGSYRRWIGLFEEKLLQTYGFDNVTRLGYLLNDINDESIGMEIVQDLTTKEEVMDKSFMGVQLDNKLKFRLGEPQAPFWKYKSSQLTPPKLNLASTMNKFLLINYRVAAEFFQRMEIKQPRILETIFKHGDLGYRYYKFVLLYFLTESKLSPTVQESVFNLFSDTLFRKKMNYVTGVVNPFIGDLKMNHTYHTLVAKFITSDNLDIYYHNQAFSQFIAMQYASNKDELNKWIKGLIEPLIKQLEECEDEYDRQAVLFRFEQAYQK